MALSSTWIDIIFTRLSGLYGSRFTNLWSSVDPELVRKTWAHELSGFGDKPDAIKYALENLPPDQPPTALAFRKLCNQWTDTTPRLPAPRAPLPAAIREQMGQIKQIPEQQDGRAWAREILARQKAGEILNPTTARFAREALAGRGEKTE